MQYVVANKIKWKVEPLAQKTLSPVFWRQDSSVVLYPKSHIQFACKFDVKKIRMTIGEKDKS